MDERHGQPSGAVLKKLCERAFERFGQTAYQRLANISVSHLYNLRRSKTCQRQRCTLTKTRPKAVSIGQRRKPYPNNQPGYIRIDSVHQGDQDKRKGIYHINAVDEVTQYQIVVTLERITEAFMKPALPQILAAFPFKIQGFHADNGSEYINYTVAERLETLRIEFTIPQGQTPLISDPFNLLPAKWDSSTYYPNIFLMQFLQDMEMKTMPKKCKA